jgi:hypothetical protein
VAYLPRHSDDEIRQRERFLQQHGRHLPRPFHELAVMAGAVGKRGGSIRVRPVLTDILPMSRLFWSRN